MDNTTTNKVKVRYGVHYNDRNYEYVLHSNKKYFLRNLADVINVVEYCVTQELKNNNGKENEKVYNVEIIRFVNDVKDENWDASIFMSAVKVLINQMVVDTVQRNG